MTQEDVARKLSARLGEEVKRNYIAAVETQWRMWPSIERLMALADVYEMSQPERLMLMREMGAGDLGYEGLDVEREHEHEETLRLLDGLTARDRARFRALLRLWHDENLQSQS